MKNKFLTSFEKNILYFACFFAFFCIVTVPAEAQKYSNPQQIKKIVIDAGHGGKDPGAVGKKSKEKDITLAVALKLGDLISKNFPDVEVIYTRKTDVFVEVGERGNIANRNHADLFVSIHVDSFKPSARGASTWIMGLNKSKANLEVALRENAVIALEDDPTKYKDFSLESSIISSIIQDAQMKESYKFAEMVQNEMISNGPITGDRGVRQDGFLVLWKAAMPRILIELGFISNLAEEQILIKDENQAKIAQNIFSAFSKYKKQYEENNALETFQTSDSTKLPKAEEKTGSAKDEQENREDKTNQKNNELLIEKPALQKIYAVQIMAINKIIPTSSKDFKGHKNIKYMKVGNYYKYITGNFTNLNEAKQLCKSLQKDFKGAFVVEVGGNNLTPVR
ncbi:MAG: N-acetylmuramoyl-L-alanine amidase [Prevotellaceae bacterium]|jgi:N-acetylmuramoyl-L-alanine amidase|nr:N-acetylmuramoyl-L-alanine amidase [Prevotellaceae bacterium]